MSVGRGEYTAVDYDAMLTDPLRAPTYMQAIAENVRPGDVVVELGAGTGYFSVLAVRAGARVVYAIERNPLGRIAEEIARENGVADKVRVLIGDASTVELPERGTLLLFDLAGLMPLNSNAIDTVISVRERLLEPGARMICSHDRLYAVPCGAPKGWVSGELTLGSAPHGVSRAAMSRLAHSTVHREWIDTSLMRAEPQLLHEIDYATVTSAEVDSVLSWRFDSPGDVHGVVCWFTRTVAPGITFTTGPGAPMNVYGQPFLPFERSLRVDAGDVLHCRIRIRRFGDGHLYAWDTRLARHGATEADVVMSQSTLLPTLMENGVPTAPPLDRTAPFA